MNARPLPVVLVSDKVYLKTRRYLDKLRSLVEPTSAIILACVDGFGTGLDVSVVSDLTHSVITGNIQQLSEKIIALEVIFGQEVAIIALNQSSVLTTAAIRRILGRPERPSIVTACDKSEVRRQLAGTRSFGLDFRECIPGHRDVSLDEFRANAFIVKPVFGMSSSDVRRFSTWIEASAYAQSLHNAKAWLPAEVLETLGFDTRRTTARLIEPYVDGVEFSVDGWIVDSDFHAIVQHKLCMVERTFYGDGPTVSPPVVYPDAGFGWCGLQNDEATICDFAREILTEIGYKRGVFHIEGRERHDDARLSVIEINPRAPGGSLWRSAFFRTGYDLELVDAAIQLEKSVPFPTRILGRYVFHYPFYASEPGELVDWGDLSGLESEMRDVYVDFAVPLKTRFDERDFREEPYLAFVVAHDDTLDGMMTKLRTVAGLRAPSIAQSR
jgi:hypothetical protein